MLKTKNTLRAVAISALAAGVLVACGGGSSGGAAAPATVVSGSGIKGPVFDATVTVTPKTGAAVDCGTTARDGSYTCKIPATAVGPFVITLSGGTYCSDESQVAANGSCPGNAMAKPQGANDALQTVAVASKTTGAILPAPITPFTTAAVKNAQAGAGVESFVQEYVTLATTYGLDTNPTVTPNLSSASSRATALLKAISADNSSLATAIANIQKGNNPTEDNPASSVPFNSATDAGGTTADSTTGNPDNLGVSTGGGTVTGGTGSTNA